MIPEALMIINRYGLPGTAGAIVRDARGARFLLSSYHVVFGNGAAIGDPVYTSVGAWSLRHAVIGHAARGFAGPIDYDGEPVFIDAALIAVQNAAWSEGNACLVGTADAGEIVSKTGSATGSTQGVVVDADYTDFPHVCGESYTAPRQLLIESRDRLPAGSVLSFSAPGDSGAVVTNGAGQAVGLIWGSNCRGDGIACPLEPILAHLNVEFEMLVHRRESGIPIDRQKVLS